MVEGIPSTTSMNKSDVYSSSIPYFMTKALYHKKLIPYLE